MTEQSEPERVTVAMSAVVELTHALSVRDINQLVGCWERQVDAQWWIALNGHRAPVFCSKGIEVMPFTCYVEYNGWPAGFIDAGGGILAAAATANEDMFIAACQAAAKAEKASQAK